ncbi:MAG: aspartate/glutamate racemase family protein [Pseudomonadota bacterium]
MSAPILVINPNSNPEVTAGLDEAVAPFRLVGGPPIECLTLAEGPFGIESQAQSDLVVAPLLAFAETRADAAAVVVACYSDPGLETLRERLPIPVFGMQEAGVLAALGRGDLIGVIAAATPSIRRHRRYLRRMGALDRLAGEAPLDLTVAETGGAAAWPRLLAAGETLQAQGAEALVLGCAGMARHRARLETALDLPVIEPVQAAVAAALGALLPAEA